MPSDLDALRKRLQPKWSHSRKTERECYMDGVDAALAALEQVGWRYYSHRGFVLEDRGPDIKPGAVAVYRIVPVPCGQPPSDTPVKATLSARNKRVTE